MTAPQLRVGIALAALLLSFESAAGSAGGAFSVNIVLNARGSGSATVTGICTNQTLSQSAGAEVRVVCNSNQFVSISPTEGARFAGSHGGAYTYWYNPGAGENRLQYSADRSHGVGVGTVTGYRVYSLDEEGGPFDVLVSF